MKKSLLWISVLLVSMFILSTFSLAGCKTTTAIETIAAETTKAAETTTATTAAETTKAEPVTLEFWSWNNEGAYPIIHEDAANRFMAENPNVKIERKYISYADYVPALKAAIAGGEAPDLIQVPNALIQDLEKSGALLPLNDYFKEGFPAFFEPTMAKMRMNGNDYMAPFNVISDQIAYNVEMFQQYGIEIPKTMDDLINAAKILAKNGKFGIAIGTKDKWAGAYLLWAQNIYTDPTHTLMTKAEAGEIPWAQTGLKAAAERVIQYLKADVFAPGANSMDAFVGAKDLFVQQKAGMYFPMGSFTSKGFIDSIAGAFTFSMFPFPPKDASEGSPTTLAAMGANFAISSASKNPDVAAAFLRKLFDDNAAKTMYENQFIPSYPYTYTGDKPADAVFQNLMEAQKTAILDIAFNSAVSAGIYSGMQGVLGGELTADKLIESLQKAFDEAK